MLLFLPAICANINYFCVTVIFICMFLVLLKLPLLGPPAAVVSGRSSLGLWPSVSWTWLSLHVPTRPSYNVRSVEICPVPAPALPSRPTGQLLTRPRFHLVRQDSVCPIWVKRNPLKDGKVFNCLGGPLSCLPSWHRLSSGE